MYTNATVIITPKEHESWMFKSVHVAFYDLNLKKFEQITE